ncbi:MAG TPA: tetratricopeptide repeat protein, partial [Methylomirabilota bacterium]|nr:tetratricopeptide repeat protein [Methylomirabilota bacterium]
TARMKQQRTSPNYLPLILGAIVAVAAALVYLPTLRADFVHWDDGIEIYANPHLGPLTLERLEWMFTDTKYVWRYQPLTWLSWTLNYHFSGLEPSSYHFGNWILHSGNALLLFLCLARLFELIAPESPQRRLRIHAAAFSGAMLWALHPLRVEPVSWATGRLYVQGMFFLLLSFSFYLRARFPFGSRKPFNLDYWLAAVFFILSLLSYPIAVGYAPALLALELCLWQRRRQPVTAGLKDIAKHAAPLWLLTALIFSISLAARFFVREEFEAPANLDVFGVTQRLAQACYIWAHYLWRPLWPTDLSPIYTTLLQVRVGDLRFLFSAVLVVGITLFFALRWRRYPGAAALWAAHLLLLFPHLGLTERPHYPSDRYSYLQGVVVAVAMAVPILYCKAHHSLVAIALAVSLCFGALSLKQTAIWHDSFALFDHILSLLGNHPVRADIYSRYGVVHGEKGNVDEAVSWLKKAIAVDPRFVDAHANLGRTCLLAERYAEAEQAYSTAASLAPDRADLRNALGDVHFAARDFAKAEREYREAARLRPREATSHSNLGIALAAQKQFQQAEAAFIQAHELEPRNTEHLQNLSTLMRQMGRTNEAQKYKAEIEELTRGHGHAH